MHTVFSTSIIYLFLLKAAFRNKRDMSLLGSTLGAFCVIGVVLWKMLTSVFSSPFSTHTASLAWLSFFPFSLYMSSYTLRLTHHTTYLGFLCVMGVWQVAQFSIKTAFHCSKVPSLLGDAWVKSMCLLAMSYAQTQSTEIISCTQFW